MNTAPTASTFNVSTTLELNKKYMSQLVYILQPCIIQGLFSIYNDSKTIKSIRAVTNSDGNQPNQANTSNELMCFQRALLSIRNWPESHKQQEAQRIKTVSAVTYLDKLISVLFKTNCITMSYSSIDNETLMTVIKNCNIATHDFIYKCYVLCAEDFYHVPFLFYNDPNNDIENKRNIITIRSIVKKSIKNSLQMLSPISILLDIYLGNIVHGTHMTDDEKAAVLVDVGSDCINRKLSDGKDRKDVAVQVPEMLASVTPSSHQPKSMTSRSSSAHVASSMSSSHKNTKPSLPVAQEFKVISIGRKHVTRTNPNPTQGNQSQLNSSHNHNHHNPHHNNSTAHNTHATLADAYYDLDNFNPTFMSRDNNADLYIDEVYGDSVRN